MNDCGRSGSVGARRGQAGFRRGSGGSLPRPKRRRAAAFHDAGARRHIPGAGGAFGSAAAYGGMRPTSAGGLALTEVHDGEHDKIRRIDLENAFDDRLLFGLLARAISSRPVWHTPAAWPCGFPFIRTQNLRTGANGTRTSWIFRFLYNDNL